MDSVDEIEIHCNWSGLGRRTVQGNCNRRMVGEAKNDFFPFKKNPPSRETSRMWDDLFESVVATGKNVVATSADQLEIVQVQETCEEESSGGNDSDMDPDNVDDETETPLGNTQDTPQSVPAKKSKKSGAYNPSFSSESIKKMKLTPGTKLFANSCEMVSNASLEFIKAIKGSKSSAAATSRTEQDETEFDAALTHLNDLVAIGLVDEDSRLWCYEMTELAKADRRRIFMKCKLMQERSHGYNMSTTWRLQVFPAECELESYYFLLSSLIMY